MQSQIQSRSSERSLFPVAVHIFFVQGNHILLLRRFNTGYEDGNYSVVAGHVEAGETVRQAALREAQEEVGIRVQEKEVALVHVMHRRSQDERIDFFVEVKNWSGTLTNTEPHKCDELAWHTLDALPQNTIPYIKQAIADYQDRVLYSEFGW